MTIIYILRSEVGLEILRIFDLERSDKSYSAQRVVIPSTVDWADVRVFVSIQEIVTAGVTACYC